jgi:hypothetical protein
MYAKDRAYVVMPEEEPGKESAIGGAVVTILLALTLTLSLFAAIGAVALFLI